MVVLASLAVSTSPAPEAKEELPWTGTQFFEPGDGEYVAGTFVVRTTVEMSGFRFGLVTYSLDDEICVDVQIAPTAAMGSHSTSGSCVEEGYLDVPVDQPALVTGQGMLMAAVSATPEIDDSFVPFMFSHVEGRVLDEVTRIHVHWSNGQVTSVVPDEGFFLAVVSGVHVALDVVTVSAAGESVIVLCEDLNVDCQVPPPAQPIPE